MSNVPLRVQCSESPNPSHPLVASEASGAHASWKSCAAVQPCGAVRGPAISINMGKMDEASAGEPSIPLCRNEMALCRNETAPQALLHNHVGLSGELVDFDAVAKLTILDLQERGLGDAGATRLARVITQNSSLKTLELKGNGIGCRGAERIAVALVGGCPLSRLGLSWNAIGDPGAMRLAVATREVPTLTELDLSHNRIGDEGAGWLMEALVESMALTTVGLHGNLITEASSPSLVDSMAGRQSEVRPPPPPLPALPPMNMDLNCCAAEQMQLPEQDIAKRGISQHGFSELALSFAEL